MNNKKLVIHISSLLFALGLNPLSASGLYEEEIKIKLVERMSYNSGRLDTTSKIDIDVPYNDGKLKLHGKSGGFGIIVQDKGSIAGKFRLTNLSNTKSFKFQMKLDLLDINKKSIDTMTTDMYPQTEEYLLPIGERKDFSFNFICEKYDKIKDIKNHKCSLIDVKVTHTKKDSWSFFGLLNEKNKVNKNKDTFLFAICHFKEYVRGLFPSSDYCAKGIEKLNGMLVVDSYFWIKSKSLVDGCEFYIKTIWRKAEKGGINLFFRHEFTALKSSYENKKKLLIFIGSGEKSEAPKKIIIIPFGKCKNLSCPKNGLFSNKNDIVSVKNSFLSNCYNYTSLGKPIPCKILKKIWGSSKK